MALEHAIMVSLAERPGTGYEISRQFERSIGYFWSATHQQIYRTLKKLHTDGLVDMQDVPQQGRPDKKVYTLSGAGRDALRAWVSDPGPVPRLRDELSVRLGAAEHGDLRDLVAEFQRHRDAHQERLTLYRRFAETDLTPSTATRGRRLHQRLVLQGGIRVEEGLIAWCDEVIDALDSEIAADAPQPLTTTAKA